MVVTLQHPSLSVWRSRYLFRSLGVYYSALAYKSMKLAAHGASRSVTRLELGTT
jgi:hypothetical protein